MSIEEIKSEMEKLKVEMDFADAEFREKAASVRKRMMELKNLALNI